MSATVPERVRARITRIETGAGLEDSRPTPLRTSGFLLLVVGAAMLGIGAVSPWITVGIPNESVHSSMIGTDLIDGRVALACTVAVLTSTLMSRLIRTWRTRYTLTAVVAGAAIVGTLLGASFISNGKDRGVVIAAIGIPKDLWARFGVFRDLDAGPYLVVVGGVLCAAGAVLTFSWLRQTSLLTAEDSLETSSG
jgi:hypothetical protein